MKAEMKAVLVTFIAACLYFQGTAGMNCYECGYKQMGEGQPGPIDGDLPFCYDSANPSDVNKKDCADSCCVASKEFLKVVGEDGTETEIVVGMHTCLKDLLPDHQTIKCNLGSSEKNCTVIQEEFPGHNHTDTFINAEVCLCSQELCNQVDPMPQSTTQVSPDARICYDCGYKQTDGGDPEALPEGVNFCKDFTKPTEDHTRSCPRDDCCATIKEYTTEGGKSVVVARHACSSDINPGYNKTCTADAAETCAVYNRQMGDVTVNAELCNCDDKNLCNSDVPRIPPSSASALLVSSFALGLSILMAFFH